MRSKDRLRTPTNFVARQIEVDAKLVRLVEEQPDATFSELRERLGVSVSLATIWTTLKKLGLTLKKSPAGG